jgi:hypothetical protein
MADEHDETTTEDESADLAGLEQLLTQSTPGTGGEDEEATGKPKDRKELAARLQECASRFSEVNTFKPGQLVQWKRAMKNRRNPPYGAPVIVVSVLVDQTFEREIKGGAGSTYFREPLTVLAGMVDKNGDFVCFHYDGRRFEPYDAK